MTEMQENIERAKDWEMAKAYLRRILCSFNGGSPAYEILRDKFAEFEQWMDEEGPMA